MSGKTFTLHVLTSDAVDTVRMRVWKHSGIMPYQQRLMVAGVELVGWSGWPMRMSRLSDYNIHNGSIIDFVVTCGCDKGLICPLHKQSSEECNSQAKFRRLQ